MQIIDTLEKYLVQVYRFVLPYVRPVTVAIYVIILALLLAIRKTRKLAIVWMIFGGLVAMIVFYGFLSIL